MRTENRRESRRVEENRGPSRLPVPSDSSRRSSALPDSSRLSRAGSSLVEILVSVLLLFIVFCSWAAMNNIQAVRRESFRCAAVEKAAGMLDAMSSSPDAFRPNYVYKLDGDTFVRRGMMSSDLEVYPLWPENADATIGYRIECSQKSGRESGWTNGIWGTVLLYDRFRGPGTGSPFANFKMLLKRNVNSNDP